MESKYTGIIFLLLISFTCRSEVISGTANVYIEPNKQTILSLNNGVEVNCDRLQDGWFKIAVAIKLTADEYEKRLPILKGHKLFDANDKQLGVVLADIPAEMTNSYVSGGAPVNSRGYYMEISGFVTADNISANSIPENPLSDLVNKHRDNLSIAVFKNLIAANHYDKYGLLGKFYPQLIEYMLSESDVDDPSPIDRLRLIFENNRLIAIIHSRDLKIDGAKDYDLLYGNKIMIFKTPDGVSLQTFIQKNKEAYHGAN